MKKIFLFLILASLTGCSLAGPQTSKEGASDNLEAEKQLNIVTSFYPLEFFTKEIVGDKIEVTNLAENQGVHEFVPSPQDIIKLQKANLVIVQGAELEPWAEDMIPQLTDKEIPVLEVSTHLDLHKMEEDEHHHEEEAEEHEDEHHDEERHHHDEAEHHADEEDNHSHNEDEEEHEHEEAHHEEGHHHHHGEFDPHTWLDPVLAQNMIDVIAQKIGEIDPQNIDLYTQNAEALKEKIQEFDAKYSNLSCEKDEAIISHDAFGYIARRYGFYLHPIAGISNHDEPSAKLLAELKEEAEEGITHILTEENNIKRFAETLAQETGLKMVPIYALGENSKPFFEGYQINYDSIKTALNCQ